MSEKSNFLPDVDLFGQADNDDTLLSLLHEKIGELRQDEKIDDFSTELKWALQIITTKALNKSQALYKLGIIYIGKFVAINTNSLSRFFLLSPSQLSRKIKHWSNVFWDINDKKNLLAQYDIRADMRQWILKQVPLTDPVMIFSDFQPTQDKVEEIHFVNAPPPTKPSQLSRVSLDIFKQIDFITRKGFSIAPKLWTFEKTPDEILLFGD